MICLETYALSPILLHPRPPNPPDRAGSDHTKNDEEQCGSEPSPVFHFVLLEIQDLRLFHAPGQPVAAAGAALISDVSKSVVTFVVLN